MVATQSTNTAIRGYRVYLRDTHNEIARSQDVDLGSDEDARVLAMLVLDKQAAYPCVEVWDRARLVCKMRREE